MLKLEQYPTYRLMFYQPPSGGCVLKPLKWPYMSTVYAQPPSGGCVLKQSYLRMYLGS